MKLTCKNIKLDVSRALATDPTLSDAIQVAVGFTPRWSTMDALEYLLVWAAYKALTPTSVDEQAKYRSVFHDLQEVYNVLKGDQPCRP